MKYTYVHSMKHNFSCNISILTILNKNENTIEDLMLMQNTIARSKENKNILQNKFEDKSKTQFLPSSWSIVHRLLQLVNKQTIQNSWLQLVNLFWKG